MTENETVNELGAAFLVLISIRFCQRFEENKSGLLRRLGERAVTEMEGK